MIDLDKELADVLRGCKLEAERFLRRPVPPLFAGLCASDVPRDSNGKVVLTVQWRP